jgi:hypothetical protein
MGLMILVIAGCPLTNETNKENQKFTVSISPLPDNGTIEPNIAEAEAGTTINLAITPSIGYVLLEGSLKYNDGMDHIISEPSFIMPAHNITVTCTFERDKENQKFTVSISPLPDNGTIEPNITEAEAGTTINLVITPSIGYVLLEGSLKYNDGMDHIISEPSFIMPAHNVTVTCTFMNPGLEELANILKFLQSSENNSRGNSKNDPIPISLTTYISLEQLYDILATADKYVNLDLSSTGIKNWNYIRGYKTGKGKIVSLILPDALTNLPDNTGVKFEEGFASFDNLMSISGTNIQTVGGAFQDCKELVNVDLPTVITLGSFAFSGCNKLTEISLPAALSIGYAAFSDCTRLAVVNLPVATSIDGSAFSNCYNLLEINIPGIISIGRSAFYYCELLKNLYLPANTPIGDGAFTRCSSLVFTITGAGDLSTIEDGKVLLKNDTTLVSYPSAVGNINIPSNITTIGNHAFSCTKIAAITSTSVTSIGDLAFSSCDNLTTINLGTVIQIGEDAFTNCNFAVVNFPSAQIIGTGAFSSCSNLLTIELPNATTIGESAFFHCNKLTTVNVPNVRIIGRSAFTACFNLAYLNIPNITVIKEYAFDYCYGLKTLRMGITPPETIGENVFRGVQGSITFQVPIGLRGIYETWERANRQTMWWSVNIVEVS